MKYCFDCGSRLSLEIPSGDDRLRWVCQACSWIHYDNPRVLVAAFLYHNKKLLWTRRGTQPNKGLWAFPAGFLEMGETLQQAAARELFEETHIVKSPKEMIPMSLGSVVNIDQVYVVFRSPCQQERMVELTPETEGWGWYDEREAPWHEMAHPETEAQVRQVYHWVQAGRFGMRVGEVTSEGGDYSVFPMHE